MFTEDGVFCSPALGYPTGKQAIKELYEKLLPGTKSSTHVIGNQQVWFKEADTAIVYCYLHAWQTFEEYPKKPDVFSYGRYELETVREDDGEWRVRKFKIVFAGQLGGGKACDHFARPWPPDPSVE
jgi:ketosteroid isomerase-like protein